MRFTATGITAFVPGDLLMLLIDNLLVSRSALAPMIVSPRASSRMVCQVLVPAQLDEQQQPTGGNVAARRPLLIANYAVQKYGYTDMGIMCE